MVGTLYVQIFVRMMMSCSNQEPPYIMLKRPEQLFSGNERFEGFCIDLLKQIAHIVGFTYRIELVPDNKYGAPEKGEWNGLVRELLDKVTNSSS